MDDRRRLLVDQVPHLRRYARALVRDPQAADDLVQDCLTRAMDRLEQWRPGSNMRTWLFAILHNLHVNAARRQARSPVGPGPVRDGKGPHGAPEQDGRHEMRDLGRALDKLPEDQRQVVLLVGLEGLKYREVAEVLNIPVGTVMSRLDRGRRRLRDILERDGVPTLRRVK